MPEPLPSAENDAASPAPPLSRLDTFFLPLSILILVNVACFSGLVSFRLRPHGETRMLPIMSMVFAGMLAGGWLFPRLAAWAETSRRRGRGGWYKAAMVAWALFPVATVMPGTEQYIDNEPLRYLANLALGMTVAPAFYLFFDRMPAGRRGMWFGITEAAGFVTMLLLNHAATEAAPSHPLLPTVYVVHAGGLAVLSALLIYALLIRPAPWTIPTVRSDRRDSRKDRFVALGILSIGLIVFFMSGLLNAQLTPFLVAPPTVSWRHMVTAIIMAVATLATGWLYDRYHGTFARSSIVGCCWLFLIAPCLALLGDNPWLHLALSLVSAGCQYAVYAVCILSLVNRAANAGQAAFWTCSFLTMRMGIVFGLMVWQWSVGTANQGVTVFIATAFAALAFTLARRVESVADRIPDDRADPMPASDPATASAGTTLETFLSRVDLTPREMEAAQYILQGASTKRISEELGISERAVTKRVTKVFRKFAVPNRRAFYAAYLATLTGQVEGGKGDFQEEFSTAITDE